VEYEERRHHGNHHPPDARSRDVIGGDIQTELAKDRDSDDTDQDNSDSDASDYPPTLRDSRSPDCGDQCGANGEHHDDPAQLRLQAIGGIIEVDEREDGHRESGETEHETEAIDMGSLILEYSPLVATVHYFLLMNAHGKGDGAEKRALRAAPMVSS
jgi:hypothetical protein